MTDVSDSHASLCHLLVQCKEPLNILENVANILQSGVDVNLEVPVHGGTPLSWLVRQTNRGLRYHRYPLPEMTQLESSQAAPEDILKSCAKYDRLYQEQVQKSMKLLLDHGAVCDLKLKTCPTILHQVDRCKQMYFDECYEHKVFQQEDRWNLLAFGQSVEFSTYSIFDPLNTSRLVINDLGVTILHVAAWRGDAQCLAMLLENGADIHTQATDSRNALHFLYFYCNKPSDLAESTRLLVHHGIDVNQRDTVFGATPLFLLLRHIYMKRGYVRYLANSYDVTSDQSPECDHYQEAIKECVDILLHAGADLNACDFAGDDILHSIFTTFLDYYLEKASEGIQVKNHYMVPYRFSIKPLHTFSELLIQRGCMVRAPSGTVAPLLSRLIGILHKLYISESLNPPAEVLQCFQVLLINGAECSTKNFKGLSILHEAVYLITSKFLGPEVYEPLLALLVRHGADIGGITSLSAAAIFPMPTQTCNMQTATVLHIAISQFSYKPLHRLCLVSNLLMLGANPSSTVGDSTGAGLVSTCCQLPCVLLLEQHVRHHQGNYKIPHCYLALVDLLCRTMNMESIFDTFKEYKKGVFGVICTEECGMYQMLQSHCSVRKLQDICRWRIWNQMGSRFMDGIEHLPLPRDLRLYVAHLTSVEPAYQATL